GLTDSAPPPGSGVARALFVDPDHDGDLDLFLATAAGNRAYRNNLDGTFRELAAQMGLAGARSRDASVGDFDGDGRTDLVVVGADGRIGLFHNLGQGHFQDVTATSGLAAVSHAGAVAVADYDHDGDLDLIVVGWDGRPRLLRNDGGNVNQYVQVHLVGLRQGSGKNNAFGLGATLELRSRDLYQLRLVTDRVTHFGLGRPLKADGLRLRWPNGVSQTVYYPGTEEDVLEQQFLKGS